MRCPRPGCVTVTVSLAALLGGCSSLPTEPIEALTFSFDFHQGRQGFTAGFADYPPAQPEIYELVSDYRTLPVPLEPPSAVFISGVNRSDDLFMFFKGAIGGLRPGAFYVVTIGLEIATYTPAGCFGVGGAPGESVWNRGRRDRGRTAPGPRRRLPADEHRHRQSVP